MAGFDLTRASGILKRVHDKKLHEILYSSDSVKLNPGFTMLKKEAGKKVQTPFGSAFVVPIKHGRVSASSVTYSTAQAIAASSTNGAAPKYAQFLVTPSKYYTVHRVDADVLDRATDEGSFIDAAAEVMKDALQAHMRRLCIHSHGTGSGKVGTISAVDATTVTVAPSEVRNFEVGDELQAAATELGGALRSATIVRVTTRNSVTGVLGASTDPTALSWAAGDSLFYSGDRENTGSPTAQVFRGFFGWVPQTAPAASESFFGVDRSIDSRLGGLRFDATGKTYRQALIEAAMLAAGEGSMITRCRMSFVDYAALCAESDDLKTIELSSPNTTIGFKGIELAGATGAFTVVPDESVPTQHALMETDDWRLLYAQDDIAKVVSHDGLMLRKVEAADSYEMYVKSVIQPVCSAPGHQVHVYDLGT